MEKIYYLYIRINDESLMLTDEAFNSVAVSHYNGEMYKEATGHHLENTNLITDEMYYTFYNDEEEDYKDSLESVIDAFCKVHNMTKDDDGFWKYVDCDCRAIEYEVRDDYDE